MHREEILARLRERIVAIAASRIQRDQAEDLAQEVLEVIEQRYANVAALAELLPLSLKILRFKLAASRRTRERRGVTDDLAEMQVADSRPSYESYAEREELLRILANA